MEIIVAIMNIINDYKWCMVVCEMSEMSSG